MKESDLMHIMGQQMKSMMYDLNADYCQQGQKATV